ncbi:Gfo/Idh/MocA family oxidoreductase [Georgenia sp. 311]|uniref:Gfo/Idh/MocA family oxidoreductase n=1 Tax=Georgenia wutianyii TaxID=2585135 RepID=A0ABX5VLC3_9MICO|nr:MULTISPECIES: Gfo/Idh/MocA family oxidoreductase [Georgenia]QDB79262.1 Gfo/Idh/MocA family oxidoreductase [Georgenia wutianyii]TNC18750.1 Gfo/Idh/MocA family oxidoreductase [Georgenia sp. 311]
MRVAVIGLGDIAGKAYLPVLAATAGVTPVLVSRRRATLDAVGERYRVAERFTSLDDAIATGLDAATVHAPTAVHPEVVETLLRHRVPVLVDKPIAQDHATAAALVSLATRLGVSLAVGFNRRHAPAVRALAEWPDLDVVTLQKHRSHPLGPARAMVFDDFIHVLDTLRFLVPSTLTDLTVSVRGGGGGTARRLAVHFTGEDGRLATGVMSWTAGMSHEVLDVVGDGRRRQVVDLADIVDLAGQERLTRRDGWRPATALRGFDAMCAEFLSAVAAGRILDATDALATHELCERVVEAAEAVTGQG